MLDPQWYPSPSLETRKDRTAWGIGGLGWLDPSGNLSKKKHGCTHPYEVDKRYQINERIEPVKPGCWFDWFVFFFIPLSLNENLIKSQPIHFFGGIPQQSWAPDRLVSLVGQTRVLIYNYLICIRINFIWYSHHKLNVLGPLEISATGKPNWINV
jgi:hypothetical protein